MQISEQELRAMIRDAIARHGAGNRASEPVAPPLPDTRELRVHASHGLFVVAGTPDGECIIEPNHRCDHCGYCKSLGH
ncbi:MAG: hypothetical protein QM736_08635 [Vicinamibacterales bacterium]